MYAKGKGCYLYIQKGNTTIMMKGVEMSLMIVYLGDRYPCVMLGLYHNHREYFRLRFPLDG